MLVLQTYVKALPNKNTLSTGLEQNPWQHLIAVIVFDRETGTVQNPLMRPGSRNDKSETSFGVCFFSLRANRLQLVNFQRPVRNRRSGPTRSIAAYERPMTRLKPPIIAESQFTVCFRFISRCSQTIHFRIRIKKYFVLMSRRSGISYCDRSWKLPSGSWVYHRVWVVVEKRPEGRNAYLPGQISLRASS